MWEKIVLNLVSNAFKFTFDGEIRVGLRARDEDVELSVADTGVGIPEAELDPCSSGFTTCATAGRARTKEPASGWHWPRARALARRLGHGQKRRGSRDDLHRQHSPRDVSPARGPPLRRAAADTDQPRGDPVRRSPALGTGLEPATRNARRSSRACQSAPERRFASAAKRPTLLADDNADMRDYLARILGQHYRVEMVADGAEALDRIRPWSQLTAASSRSVNQARGECWRFAHAHE
jgi:hypothetical protein